VHPPETVAEARRLYDSGLRIQDVARAMRLPQRTVHHWCRGTRRSGRTRRDLTTCPRCTASPLDRERYAYLLGMYLGDGHITQSLRSHRLWIFCADAWPGVIAEVVHAMGTVLTSSSVSTVRRTGCVAVASYSKHWTCLFPQHGPGMKYQRAIVLEPWQEQIVREHSAAFVRGLFHSDGCRTVNRTRAVVNGAEKVYEYPRWMFSNRSEDIHRLCEAALDRLGIAHRRSRADTISVARRDAVALMDRLVGPKT
jgi:hypothetical protein